MGIVAAAAMAFSSCAAPRLASAQSNYRLNPTGGRSQLMGGTGLAYGRDASASFLNPATAVLVDDNRLSFSVNFYKIAFEYAPRWYRSGPIDRSKFGDNLYVQDATLQSINFDALPASLCFFFRMGDIPGLHVKKDPRTREAKLGMCFAQIYDDRASFAAEGFSEVHTGTVARQAQTLSQKFVRFAMGPTYAMHVTNALAIGASLHASLATHRNLMAANATTYNQPTSGSGAGSSNTNTPISSTFYDSSRGDAFALEATVGGTFRFGKQTVALSIKSPSVHVYGVGGVNQQSHFEGAGSGTSGVTVDGSFVSRSPLRIGLGSGLEGKWGLAEVNITYSTPLGQAYSAELVGHQIESSPSSFSDREVSFLFSEPARGVVNMAAGVEMQMSPRISVLSGISTDVSAAPSGLPGGLFNYYPHRTNRVAGSFGVGSHGLGGGGELLVGGELSVGWGERLAVNSYQLPPVASSTDHSTYELMFVIAGSTTLRTLQRAVEDVKNIVNEPTRQEPMNMPKVQRPLVEAPTSPSPPPQAPPPKKD